MRAEQITINVAASTKRRRLSIWRPDLHHVAIGLICLVPILLYAPMLATPFNGDEGFYATVARIVLHGGLPYRDAFDNKPPMVFVWYAASFLLFGEHVWAPRLLVALLLSLTTGLVYAEGRLVFSRGAGLIAAAAFAFSVGIAKFETNAQTEYFMLLPMVGGLVAFTMATRSNDMRWYLLAGVLNGLAIITRQTAVFPFAAILAHAAFFHPTERTGRRAASARPMIVMLLGAAAVGIVTFLPFLLTRTAGDFWDALVIYGWTYSNDVPAYGKIINFFLNILPVTFVAGPWVLFAALGIADSRGAGSRPQAGLLVAWLAGSILAVALVGRFYHHQFVELLPGFALMAPAGVLYAQRHWDRFWFRLSLCLSVSLTVSLSLAFNGAVYLKSDPAERHIAVYREQERTEWQTRSPIVGDYIRDHSLESDTIYNVGFQPELYFYADRRPASRYAFDHLFLTDDSLEQKALEDLQRDPPVYIIDSAANETQRQPYSAPLIRQFMQANYDYVGKVEYADIYRLRVR